jgi:CubicO group peptidase (beta-lactamase class C family)/PKD repeat protein
MKKIFSLFILLFTLASSQAQTAGCCPKFTLVPDYQSCDRQQQGGTPGGFIECFLTACKGTKQTYTVFPALLGFTYTFSTPGGTVVSSNNNQSTILWGNVTNAPLYVYVSGNGGQCKDTIKVEDVCLMESPIANFNFSPASPICKNTLVNFTSTSIGGTMFEWNFGDGNSSTLQNPSHSYTAAGTYTVTLVVIKAPLNSSTNPAGGQQKNCGCRDTIQKQIVVKNEDPLQIEPGCKQMLCKGDTASYCTPNNCPSYNWSVVGGRLLGAANQKCVKVIWDGSYPAIVTLTSNCGGTCGNTASLQVPVLYPTMPITGLNIVCSNELNGYSLPAMPGTFYNWTITGNGSIVGYNQNTPSVNVNAGANGTYTLKCNYKNPNTKCEGEATIVVNIKPVFKITGNPNLCIGDVGNFSVADGGSANWTISPNTGITPAGPYNGTSSVAITFNTLGSYNLQATPVTTTNYCRYPDKVVVVINDTPKLNSITGPTKICPGGLGLYKISSNISDGFFYWTVTGGSHTSLGAFNDSVSVTWNAVGPYKLEVYQKTEAGCISSKIVLVVDTFAAPIFTGPLNACMDNVATYTSTTAAPVGGYAWSINSGLGTIQTGQGTNTITVLWHGVAPPQKDTTSINLKICNKVYSLNVKVNMPLPGVIVESGTFCSTGGLTLTAPSGGTGYSWQLNNLPIAGTTNTLAATQSGVYEVSYTDANGCKVKAAKSVLNQALNINAYISTATKTYWLCNEVISVPLVANPTSGGYCYQWRRLTSPTTSVPLGVTTSTFTATTVGQYFCIVSVCSTGCVKSTDTLSIVQESCAPQGNCDPNYTADFTFTNCNPVKFISTTSVPSINSPTWYFGGGSPIQTGNVVFNNYVSIGTYSVCAVFGGNGYCRKVVCKNVTINVAPNFTAAAACDKVTITNLSQHTGSVTYNWNFPGGSPATSSSPTPPVVTYATAGTHLITLNILESNGCVNTIAKEVKTALLNGTINVPSPICAKTEAPFTSSVTSSSNIVYNWNFGDGYTSNLAQPSHAYQTSGPYTITLFVTNAEGCSNTITQPINVLPALNVSIQGGNQSVCVGGTKTLTAIPAGFTGYQWYHNGIAIPGATSATYNASLLGSYEVEVNNGNGCKAKANAILLSYYSSPNPKIKKMPIQCSKNNIYLSAPYATITSGNTYSWVLLSGAGTMSFTNPASNNTNATVSAYGNYNVEFTVTSNPDGCVAKDTICVMVVEPPTVSIEPSTGTLCQGQAHVLTSTVTPALVPDRYTYFWNGTLGTNSTVAITPIPYVLDVVSPNGCRATSNVITISKQPDVSLFPVGCDTMCWADTVFFPLPMPQNPGYTITWFDDAGTLVANVGTGFQLPLANLHPGIHHLYAIVSLPSGCTDTTGKFDLCIKDCTLEPPCDNCTDYVTEEKIDVEPEINSNSYQTVLSYNITFKITKPTKEIRITLADAIYAWKDTTCKNCKLKIEERSCLKATGSSNNIANLTLQNTTAPNQCAKEFVWKGSSDLAPGTYTVPLQLLLASGKNDKCKLVMKKLCFKITAIDTACKKCEKLVCYSESNGVDICKCNPGNVWSNLYLTPTKLGAPKPKQQILCDDVLKDFKINTPYLLTGIYNCVGTGCASTKNGVTVWNQVFDITYTREAVKLNETLTFTTKGYHTIELVAHCGGKSCVCRFRVYIGDDNTVPPITGTGKPEGEGIVKDLPSKIDSIVNKILPKDFNGGILVSKNDTTLYEKYVSKLDEVNYNTAFDIASITKTFTSMGVLKLMEDGKLKLEDKVNKYLDIFPFDTITIKMLLSHTSGLEDYLKFVDESNWNKNDVMSNNDLLQFIKENKSKVLRNEPGKLFDYSNTNFALLSLIIEKVSGKSYADYMSATFFKPFKMENTYVLNSQNADKAKKSYYKNGKKYGLRYLDLINGDKCIYSTVRDLKNWEKGLRTTFKPSTLTMAYASNEQKPAMTSVYALGWKTITTQSGLDIWYHTGWWAGNRSIFIRLPKGNVLIAAMSNNNHTTIEEVKRICDLFGDYKMSNAKIAKF